MLPNVHAVLASDSEVIGIATGGVWRHGSAPKGVSAPYVTWNLDVGLPENNLSDGPGIDGNLVEIDCWSENDGTGDAGVESLAAAVRDAVETVAHIESFSYDGRDPDTKRYRISMLARFWTSR